MRIRICLAIALALLVGACGSNEPTAGPVEPVTIAELDATVQATSQTLLQRSALPIAVVYFDFADREQLVRYDWIDYRPGGDLLAVTNFLNEQGAIGLARTGGEWQMAVESPDGSTPWEPRPELSGSPDVVSAIEQLEAMNTQQTPANPGSDQTLQYEATRQAASDGSELWTLITPIGDGVVDTHQWIINGDGLLQFYRLYLESAPQAGAGAVVVEYGVEDEERDPVIIPDLGTPLSLDDLGIPEALRNLEE